MIFKNELEMNHRNELEMNGDDEMNTKKIVEMNTPIAKETKKIYKDGEIEVNPGDDTMKIIETAKRKVQNGTTAYIAGIKFVISETPEVVINSIKKDFMIFPEINLIRTQDNMIKLDIGNATLYTYYFMKPETMNKVLPRLTEFGVEVLNH